MDRHEPNIVMALVYDKICHGSLAILIDPDKEGSVDIDKIIENAEKSGASLLFVGGSLVNSPLHEFVERVKRMTSLPVVLFPGSAMQFSPKADGILFLSLISGRNPEFLIGQHVNVAAMVKQSNIEVIPTGYILVDGGTPTSVQYMSQTMPIPSNKHEIAVSTAIAGELLGLKAIYLEAGSGALNPVPLKMIEKVKENISIPLIVGGGIKTPQQVTYALSAGANLVVVGNALEKNPLLLTRS
ncbi:geranylgeranylglyceryl/heptaprenylglyceryl phosphate synthase [Tenuifilum thalassicum]|nr:geranylgeranylglyceryl/heptaprenylglyceryl phosphate synthase [Tenuifilum thalassicum]